MSAACPPLSIDPARTDADWTYDLTFYLDNLDQPESWAGYTATLALVPRPLALQASNSFLLTSQDGGGLEVLANGVAIRVPAAAMADRAVTAYDFELRRHKDGAIDDVLVGSVAIQQGLSQVVEGQLVVGSLAMSGGQGGIKVIRTAKGIGVVRGGGARGDTGLSAYEQALLDDPDLGMTASEYAAQPIQAAHLANEKAGLAAAATTGADSARDAANAAASAANLAIANGAIGREPVTIATTEYTLQASDLGKVLCFTAATAVRVLVSAGLGARFNCDLVQGGAGSVAAIAHGATLLSPGLKAATQVAGEAMRVIPLGLDLYQVAGSIEPSYFQRLDVPLIAADVTAMNTFTAALAAGGVTAASQAVFVFCLTERQAALTCVTTGARTATIIGSPVWTPYRGFGAAAVGDVLSVPGLAGGAWYARRTDTVPGVGDRLGVAVYGTLTAPQQAAFEAAADVLLATVGAKNTGRTYDLVAQCGQSLFANGQTFLISATTPENRQTDRGELNWAAFHMRSAFRLPVRYVSGMRTNTVGGNFAIGGGEIAGQISLQLPFIIQSKAGFCAVEVGRNDFNAGRLWNEFIWPLYEKQLLNPLRRAGLSLIHFGNFQRDSRNNANWLPGSVQRTETQKCIDAYKPYAQGTGEPFVDRYAAVTNPAAAVPGDLYDGITIGDGIHLNRWGAHKVTVEQTVPTLTPVFGPGKDPSVYMAANLSATRAITTNAAAGTVSAPVTGVAPTGHTASKTGVNATVSGAMIQDGGGLWWYEMTITSAGVAGVAEENVNLQCSYMTGLPGEYVLMSHEVQLDNASGLVTRIGALAEGGGSSGARPRIRGLYTGTSDPATHLVPGNSVGRLVTDALKVSAPSAATARSTVTVGVDPRIAGTTKVRFRAFTCLSVADPLVEFPGVQPDN